MKILEVLTTEISYCAIAGGNTCNDPNSQALAIKPYTKKRGSTQPFTEPRSVPRCRSRPSSVAASRRVGVRPALTFDAADVRDVLRHQRAPSTRILLWVAANGIRATIRRP